MFLYSLEQIIQLKVFIKEIYLWQATKFNQRKLWKVLFARCVYNKIKQIIWKNEPIRNVNWATHLHTLFYS